MPPRIEDSDAVALVMASPLLDVEWYAAQCGRTFGSRAEAAEHWVARWARGEGENASPHPLFEPAWLYPRRLWRRHAPDPLSFWLSRPQEQVHAPHPMVSLDRTGPLEEWLRDHDPAELLPAPRPRHPVREVSVVVEVAGLQRAVFWARHLAVAARDVTAQLVTVDPVATRVLTAVTAAFPSVRVVAEPLVTRTVVRLGPEVRPPRWPWIPDLVAALEPDGVAVAQPLLLARDFTVGAGPLAGHPVADAERVSHLPLPAPWGAHARRTDRPDDGTVVLVPSSRLVVTGRSPEPPVDAATPDASWWHAAGLDGPARRPLRVREGRRALRWSIDIAAPAAFHGRKWGDFHFAHSLAAALERLGQWVAVDHPETRDRASRELDDVVLVLRGLDDVEPPAHTTNLLWVISHPEQVSAAEIARYDAAWAASTTWARARGIEPLLQCTDTTRFHPGLAGAGTGLGPRALFVGNSRGELRPSVALARRTGLDLTVIGEGWPEDVPVAGRSVPNEELGALYASAGIVLNDHWADMRAEGFVSNRVFDVLATGARLLSDDVAGLREAVGAEVGDAVRTWRTDAEFAALASGDPDEQWPSAAQRLRTAELVVAEHGFDARAGTLLQRALALLDSRG